MAKSPVSDDVAIDSSLSTQGSSREDEAQSSGLSASTVLPELPDEGRMGSTLSVGDAHAATERAAPAPGISAFSERWDVARLPIIPRSDYDVEGNFAQGGLGRILKARDPMLERPVALKEMIDPRGRDYERFMREAVLTARLQHPAIVPVYEVGRWPSGEPFYAMKLVSGRSLDELIAGAGSLEKRLVLLPHTLAVAEAVAYAHSQHVIHRDLKPSNVLVGAFGETVVIDWGLAKDLADRSENTREEPSLSSPTAESSPEAPNGNDLTVAGAVLGTPMYMPPEQALGFPVDERADVYALGAMLYHVLGGEPPYDGTTSQDVLRKVIAGPPPALEQRERGVPVDLVAIVSKAMARAPEQRYPTAKELADDLRRFQTGQIVGAHRYSLWERIRRVVRRHRAPVAIAATALAVIAGGATVSIQGILEAQRLAERKRVDAEAAEQRATARSDDLTLAQARALLEQDPNASIAWLKTLSPAFRRWGAVRTVAADAASRGIARIFREHSACVNGVAFSPDGALLVSTSDDRTVILRDLRTGETRPLSGHGDHVWRAAFSPDGKLLATGGKDKLVRLRKLVTGEERVLEGHEAGVALLSFSPDGSHLATRGVFEKVWLWTVATGAGRAISRTNGFGTVAFSPDGKTVAFADEGGLARVSVLNGERRLSPGIERSRGWSAFSPDGARIATADWSGAVRLWDAATGVSELLYSHADGNATSVAFSPRGDRIFSTGQEGSLKIWDVASRTLRTLKGHSNTIRQMVLSRDGTRIATADVNGTLRLWDADTGDSHLFRGFGSATGVAISPDGEMVAGAGSDGTVRLWSVPRQAFIATHGRPNAAVFSPGGKRIALLGDDGLLRVTTLSPRKRGSPSEPSGGASEPPSETVLLHSPVLPRPSPSVPRPALRFSSDSQQLAAAFHDGAIRVFQFAGGETRVLEGHQGRALSIAFTPNDERIASGGEDGTVRLWELSSGAGRILARYGAAVRAIAFSPDGKRLASSGADGVVRISSSTMDVEKKELPGHSGNVDVLVFSPDGSTLISAGDDSTLRFWDLTSGRCVVRHMAGGKIYRIELFPNGEMVASISGESSVRLWDVRTGESRGELRDYTGVIADIAVSTDGQRLAAGVSDGIVRLWDLVSGESRALGVHGGSAGVLVAFEPGDVSVVSLSDDGTLRRWPDDLPTDEASLRAWLETAAPERIDADGNLVGPPVQN